MGYSAQTGADQSAMRTVNRRLREGQDPPVYSIKPRQLAYSPTNILFFDTCRNPVVPLAVDPKTPIGFPGALDQGVASFRVAAGGACEEKLAEGFFGAGMFDEVVEGL